MLLVEKPNKSEEKDNGLKFDSANTDVPKVSKDSVNKEISKVSSVDVEKPEILAKQEKAKPATKKDFCELKSDYKNIAANSAISITGDKSLCLTSSCSQKQDEMFFDVNDKVKRNSFENKSFSGFKNDISKYTIPQRTIALSLMGKSSTKTSFDNAFEKKSRMLMFNERKTSAYDCMKNDFKHKKELF